MTHGTRVMSILSFQVSWISVCWFLSSEIPALCLFLNFVANFLLTKSFSPLWKLGQQWQFKLLSSQHLTWHSNDINTLEMWIKNTYSLSVRKAEQKWRHSKSFLSAQKHRPTSLLSRTGKEPTPYGTTWLEKELREWWDHDVHALINTTALNFMYCLFQLTKGTQCFILPQHRMSGIHFSSALKTP